MSSLQELLPWLVAMFILMGCSAFFSASEAALFSLRARDRRDLQEGSTTQKLAAALLADPDRLLSAVLFWNLVINVSFFSISSIAALSLEEEDPLLPVAFAFGSLFAIIFFSEMLPKSVAVIRAKRLAGLVSVPLAAAIKIVDPLMPFLRTINLLSQRVIWPGFQHEPYMAVEDLQQAIETSTDDAQLVAQEKAVLQNIVQLSNVRVDEWMRPRTQFTSFSPPVSLEDLEGRMTPSGYLLVTEQDSEEIASSIFLEGVATLPDQHLEHLAEPVLYVPWCTTVADVLEKMKSRDREVAAVLNEFGETIGILTLDDMLDTIFSYAPSRSKRIFDRNPIHYISRGKYLVSGMTSIKRLARQMKLELPATTNVTVSGVIQESLQRLASVGDECSWGPFHFRVIEMPSRGNMLVELTMLPSKETLS